jgi:hypothetical protein
MPGKPPPPPGAPKNEYKNSRAIKETVVKALRPNATVPYNS